METNPETIKELSVGIVKDFIDNKVPLSQGIAKCASENELNPDQIKRVVETCNTVTYLTLQKEASDRTFEFPVADYNSVMRSMAVPTAPNGVVTAEEFKESQEKQATAETAYDPDLQTLQVWTMKEYISNKARLEDLVMEKEGCVQNIGDLSMKLRADDWSLEKLAEVADQDTFTKLSVLITPMRELRSRIFKEAELTDVKKLVELYKHAQTLVAESEHRQSFEKKAVAQAASGALGMAIGGLVGGTAGLAAKGVATGYRNLGKSKILHPLDIAATAVTEPKPESNVWDNLQGRQKRF